MTLIIMSILIKLIHTFATYKIVTTSTLKKKNLNLEINDSKMGNVLQ